MTKLNRASWALRAELLFIYLFIYYMNAVLGLKEFVCDLAEESRALRAEFISECSTGTRERVKEGYAGKELIVFPPQSLGPAASAAPFV